MNCSALQTLHNFEKYVEVLRNITSDNHNLTASVMQPCRQEICYSLFGTGNADVSGIGVIVGYFIEFSLAILLASSTLFLDHKRGNQGVTAAYADCAIMLAVSVELAAAIMLIKKNFGLGASDFGGLTVQAMWIVAILVMLPICAFCWRDLNDGRAELRLCIISLGSILFFINFICRMLTKYSHGQIGTIVSRPEFKQIQYLCYGDKHDLPPAGSIAVEIFSIGGSFWVASNIFLALLDQCILVSGNSPLARAWDTIIRTLKSERQGTIIAMTSLVFWSVPLFWALITLRSWQNYFAASLDEKSGINVWSFGQILAVVVFLPVLSELFFQYLNRKPIPGVITVQQNSKGSKHSGSP